MFADLVLRELPFTPIDYQDWDSGKDVLSGFMIDLSRLNRAGKYE
jgi:hypothetical protein